VTFVLTLVLYGKHAPNWTYALTLLITLLSSCVYSLYTVVYWFKNRPARAKEKQQEAEPAGVYDEYWRRQAERTWREAAAEEERRRQNEQSQREYEHTEDIYEYEDDPFEILGVDESISEDKAKDVYRELTKKWHPDTYPTDDPRVKELATEKFVKIQKAYEQIKQLKGWK
jgi:hypothetical protein